MGVCPVCGYRGEGERCPRDGALLAEVRLRTEKGLPPPPAPALGENPGSPAAGSPGPVARPAGAEGGSNRRQFRDPLIGRVLAGRYEIVARVGSGGMGVVYKAYQAAMDRYVAVKVLLQDVARNEANVRRFHLEARAASRLHHPNTITIHDFGQTADGVLYIVMEFLEGESLDRVIAREKRILPARALRILIQVCRSLSEAHRKGVIHRDLKPDNIFLNTVGGEPDFVKVLDFGVAKLLEAERPEGGTLTQAGMVFGTPKYMSPEQAQSLPLDARSDIYSLGVILFEMLMGRPPFDAEAPINILIQHVHDDPPTFRSVRPDLAIPPAIEALVRKALAKSPDDRFASADDMASHLDACLPLAVAAGDALVVGTAAASGGVDLGVGLAGWGGDRGVPALETGTGATPSAGQSGGPTRPEGLPPAREDGTAPYLAATLTPQPDTPSLGWEASAPLGADMGIPRPVRRPRRSTALPAGLVALLLLGLAGGYVFLSRGGGGAGTPAPAAVEEPSAGPAWAAGGTGETVVAAGPADTGSHPGLPGDAAAAATPAVPAQESVEEGGGEAAPPRKGARARPGVAGKGRTVVVSLVSEPPGATVVEDGGTEVGVSPLVLRREAGTIPVRFTFRLAGRSEVSTFVVLDQDRVVRVTLPPAEAPGRGAAPAATPAPSSDRAGAAAAPVALPGEPRPAAVPLPPARTPPGARPGSAAAPAPGRGAEGPFMKFKDLKPVHFDDD